MWVDLLSLLDDFFFFGFALPILGGFTFRNSPTASSNFRGMCGTRMFLRFSLTCRFHSLAS